MPSWATHALGQPHLPQVTLCTRQPPATGGAAGCAGPSPEPSCGGVSSIPQPAYVRHPRLSLGVDTKRPSPLRAVM